MDPAAAVPWLERASKQGFARSEYTLGKMYSYGLGVPKDLKSTFEWVLKAGKHGNVRAQYNLGKMYRDGQGTEQNMKQSVAWYRSAAEHGYAKAQAGLGQRYANGEGVEQDMVQALLWTSLAAGQKLQRAIDAREKLTARMSASEIGASMRSKYETARFTVPAEKRYSCFCSPSSTRAIVMRVPGMRHTDSFSNPPAAWMASVSGIVSQGGSSSRSSISLMQMATSAAR